MELFGNHQSLLARARLSSRRRLGAGNFFRHACEVTPDPHRPVLFRTAPDGPHGWSLAQLADRVRRYALWHAGHGVGPGTHVGVFTADGLAGLLHHIAITSLGGATVLTNPGMAPETAARYLDRAGTALLVADEQRLAALPPDHGGTRTVSVERVDREADRDGDPPRHRHRPDDLVLVSHSSGTTGVPKPATFTHRGFFVGKRERLWTFPAARTDRMVTALPPSHSSGISYLSLALLLGLPTLMLDDRSGTALAEGMNAFRPTVVIGFPISLAELPVERLTARAADSVHTWMGMGDASHERHIRPLVALGAGDGRGATGSVYRDGLGSSEMGMVLFAHTHGPGTNRYGRAIGRPARVVRDAAALDDSGLRVPDGSPGMLGVHAPSVTPGYLGENDLTDDARRGRYFLTGDVVYRDPDGTWYHLDRVPDVIRTADGPVHSLPVEEVVLNVTDALDAAVVAVDAPTGDGSCPIAVVLPHEGRSLDPDDALTRCNDELRHRGLSPLGAVVVAAGRDDLPVGVTGKVLKRVLRDRHRAVLSGGRQPDAAPAAPPVGAE